MNWTAASPSPPTGEQAAGEMLLINHCTNSPLPLGEKEMHAFVLDQRGVPYICVEKASNLYILYVYRTDSYSLDKEYTEIGSHLGNIKKPQSSQLRQFYRHRAILSPYFYQYLQSIFRTGPEILHSTYSWPNTRLKYLWAVPSGQSFLPSV